MVQTWTFKCFLNASGRDLIDEWYSAQDGKARAAFDAVLEILASLPKKDWRRPQWALLSGDTCKDLSEVRIKPDRRRLRLVGYFGPEEYEYILLVGFQKQRDSDTNKACILANTRKREMIHDSGRTTVCSFP